MANNLANYKANLKDNLGALYKKFSAAPAGLKAFAIFVVMVTILHVSIILIVKGDVSNTYYEKFGVITGNIYMFTIYGIFALILATRGGRATVHRFMIMTPLILTITLHCLFLLNIIDDGGKFEKSGSVGLIWSIIIPAIWVIVIFSPGVSGYCRNINSKKTI